MIILMTIDRFVRRFDGENVEGRPFEHLKYVMNASIVSTNFMYALFVCYMSNAK